MGASVPDGNGAVQEAGADPVPEVVAEGGHLALPDGVPFTSAPGNESAINHIQPMTRSTVVTFCASWP